MRPHYKYARRVPYREFEQRVRRNPRTELLYAIAHLSAHQAKHGIAPPAERLLVPWALAGAAKEALRSGNEHRQPGITERDLQEICGAFNAVSEPLRSVPSLLIQSAYEQFPYQVSQFEEMTRPHLMYRDAVERCETEILSREFWRDLLGCEVSQATAVALLLSVTAEEENGHFRQQWLDQPNFAQIVAELPANIVADCLDRWFSADLDWFRSETNRHRSKDESVRRFDYNPLLGRPFVNLGEDKYIAPIHSLILRRVMPASLYFMALPGLDAADREAFTRDVGRVFHEYVGMQLEQLGGATLIPEIAYGSRRQRKLSVDWFVVWPELVLLVEAKSTPLTQEARAGLPRLEEDVNRTLGKGVAQVEETVQQIRAGSAAFQSIPEDRPHLAMVVTLEPYWLGNAQPIRDLVGEPSVPTMTVSARELEHFIAFALEADAPRLLIDVFNDPARRTEALANSIPRTSTMQNPLLDEAWQQLPWRTEAS